MSVAVEEFIKACYPGISVTYIIVGDGSVVFTFANRVRHTSIGNILDWDSWCIALADLQ